MNYKFKQKTFSQLLLLAVPLFFWSFDLGNVEAIRQGTEGFYLQVSKEIFHLKSWLVPTYLGEPHWSKPPLHFWLPQPFFILFGASSLFLSRLSVLLLTLSTSFLIDKWCHQHLKIKRFLIFFVLLSSLGFLKYARIYMMEMPLSLLTALASLTFYQYLEKSSLRNLLITVFFTSIANLVKGPVSFIMNFGAIFLFLLYEYFKNKSLSFKKYFKWCFASIVMGSLWYLVCYINFGQEFIDYFFLRENLGKFQSKSYPISSVIKGLLIFSLPWAFFIPVFINKKLFTSLWEKKVNRFLLFHFAFLFILWTIPSQRSHHYAIPSLPFFLILITQVLENYKKDLHPLLLKAIFFLISFFFILLAIITSLSFSFEEIRINPSAIVRTLLATLILLISAYIIVKKRSRLFYVSLASFLSLSFVWIIFAPIFYLPTIPSLIISQIKNEQVSVIYNKPYFLSELLNKEVRVLNEQLIKHDQKNPQKFYLMKEKTFKRYQMEKFLKISKSWPLWRRNSSAKLIFTAFKEKSLRPLQENMVLLIPR